MYNIHYWNKDFNKCPTNVPIFILKLDFNLETGFVENGLIHSLIHNRIYNFNECLGWDYYVEPYGEIRDD